jgi:hypothetical protein
LPALHTPIENRKTAYDRLNRGLKDILCVNCEKRVVLWDLIEQKFASEEFQQRVRQMEEQVRINIDNESKELILIGHAFAVAREAGEIFRPTPTSALGIDGEIEFRDDQGEASGRRVYLQLKLGNRYLQLANANGKEVFRIKHEGHRTYWQSQAHPVMLVIRSSDGQIRWMNVSSYLNHQSIEIRDIVFEGEPFTALNVIGLKNKLLGYVDGNE